jgi:hypothetical protein
MNNIIDRENFEQIIKKCFSKSQVCRELGLKPAGGNFKTINNKILEWGIDTSHFTGQAWNKGIFFKQIKREISLEEILVENSTYLCNTKIKKKLFKNKVKENKCEKCGIESWNGEEITLELHHINGKNTDNRIENLQILCPNCHSQTPNFSGKNKQKNLRQEQRDILYEKYGNISEEERIALKEKNKYKDPKKIKRKKEIVSKKCLNCNKEFLPTKKGKNFCCLECYKIYQRKRIPNKEDIINSFKELKSFVQVGKKYNVSDNAIRKWCESYEILEEVRNKK